MKKELTEIKQKANDFHGKKESFPTQVMQLIADELRSKLRIFYENDSYWKIDDETNTYQFYSHDVDIVRLIPQEIGRHSRPATLIAYVDLVNEYLKRNPEEIEKYKKSQHF